MRRNQDKTFLAKTNFDVYSGSKRSEKRKWRRKKWK